MDLEEEEMLCCNDGGTREVSVMHCDAGDRGSPEYVCDRWLILLLPNRSPRRVGNIPYWPQDNHFDAIVGALEDIIMEPEFARRQAEFFRRHSGKSLHPAPLASGYHHNEPTPRHARSPPLPADRWALRPRQFTLTTARRTSLSTRSCLRSTTRS
jgi:hypothetical protein